MKSKRKHDLQTNELADWIGRWILRLKPHARILGWGALVVLLAVFVFFVLPKIEGGYGAEAVSAAVFNRARGSFEAEPLREFLRTYPDSLQAPTARLMLADRVLRESAAGIAAGEGADPQAKREKQLAEARDLYTKVAETDDARRPMARVGLAMVLLEEGRLDEGRAALEEVRKEWPQSVAAVKAKAHLEALAGYEPSAFSDEPLEKPEKPKEPGEGGGEAKPGELKAPETGPPAEPKSGQMPEPKAEK
ncbi:MAG TPA: tetratricopeptide repeat protein [Phycisphaerae bacterium]|nr:tetratricopeptide repeat protein [Phycisphaerae bacterium]